MLQNLTNQVLGHYHIIQPIEEGGMASVFMASDIHLQRKIAIKVFQPKQGQEHVSEFFSRFTREARVVARLDHPNILLVHDYGEQGGLAYLVMPYLAGGSLKHLLKTRGRIPLSLALHFMSQLLGALQYAHDRGLIHRDIKPGNILFKDGHTPVLADFGLVKELARGDIAMPASTDERIVNSHMTMTSGTIMGTPYYMAPEQIRGQALPASDIYSLGLVFYEMLAGEHPLVNEEQADIFQVFHRQLHEQPRPLNEVNHTIPPQLADIVMRAIEKDVARRYQRPADFLQALQIVARQLNLMSASSPDAFSTPLPLPSPPMENHPTHTPNSNIAKAGSPYSTAFATNAVPGTLPLRRTPLRTRLTILISSILAVVVAATLIIASTLHLLGPNPPPTLTTALHTNKNVSSKNAAHPVANVAMPPTQTSCPAPGTVRAAVTAPYLPPPPIHNALVYSTFTESLDGTGSNTTLMSYDAVTGKNSKIITIPDKINMQLSGDGQWIILEKNIPPATGPIIQMVRVDGQGLQTLYCSSSAVTMANFLAAPTSADQGLYLAISELHNDTSPSATSIFDLTTGRSLFTFSSSHFYSPFSWDHTDTLYMLDEGAANQVSPFQTSLANQFNLVSFSLSSTTHSMTSTTTLPDNPIFPILAQIPPHCSSLDMSPDRLTIFISLCTGIGAGNRTCACPDSTRGPSTIVSIQGSNSTGTWNKPATFFTDKALAVIEVRAITSSTLLLQVGNNDASVKQNGLWRVNTDGTGLQRLSPEPATGALIFPSANYPNAILSQDATLYAFKTGSMQNCCGDSLFIAPLGGGPSTIVAADTADSSTTALEIAGWITT